MPAAHSDETRIHALAVLEANGGRVRETARELGIEHSTLIHWRNLAEAASGGETSKRNAEIAEQAALMGAELMLDQLSRAYDEDRLLPARDIQALAITTGIMTDKHLDYRDGRKGTQINVDARSLTLPPGLTVDELRALAAPDNNVK